MVLAWFDIVSVWFWYMLGMVAVFVSIVLVFVRYIVCMALVML